MISVVQYHTGPISASRMACINQVRANLPVGVGYELITAPVTTIAHHRALVDCQTIRRDSGFVRLTLLMENPERVWLDSDIKIVNWPVILEGVPHIFGGSCPAAVLYLGGAEDQIPAMLAEFAIGDMMCFHHLLYRIKGHHIIPAKNFEHLQLSNCKD